MPFTLAHPIAVLPLWKVSKQRLDLPALVIGATIPDIRYFIALRPVANIGHSFTGVFVEGIPSALILLLLGRYLLWRPVLALLPKPVSSRLPPERTYTFLPASRLLTIIGSIAIGAFTHIGWDSCTHSHGWVVERLEWLSAPFLELPVYKWLQHGGGVIGLLLLLLLTYRVLIQREQRYQHQHVHSRQKAVACLGIAAVAGVTTVIAIAHTQTSSPTALVVNTVIGTISGVFVGLCLYAISFYWTQSSA